MNKLQLTLLFCLLWLIAEAQEAKLASVQRFGPNDTIMVPAIVYNGELLSLRVMDNVWVFEGDEEELAKLRAKWDRLRNAVYVTYPYAKQAGYVINDLNFKLEQVDNKAERKQIIGSREKDLKTQFADPLTKLSVYQGRVLMKLINRQTGNNCYELIKEYKGGVNARLWQTVAFFFSSSLKQPYHPTAEDRMIEYFVQEYERLYYWR